MTDILYFPDDEYVDEFEATVTQADGENSYVVLNRTAFYKEGGGQPADHGKLHWETDKTDVVDVQKDHGDIKHYVDGDVPDVSTDVKGELDWERRHKHMRMHTAQHLVSWIVLNEFGASTAGNQIHADQSRIDFNPVSFDDDDVAFIGKRANEFIDDDLDVSKTMMSRDKVEEKVEEGRTDLSLIPDSVDPLRVVIIGDDDLCPCGGTHVSSLNELGGFSVVSTENKGKDTERLRFELKD